MSEKPQLCSLWLNLCMADDKWIELVPSDKAEAERLQERGLITRKGKWVTLTETGKQLVEQISA